MRNVPDTLTNERTAVFIDYHNTQNALRRAGRQIDLVGLQDYLAEGRHLIESFLCVGIVGLGGLGSAVAEHLARLGVQNRVLVDPDVVELSNLNWLCGERCAAIGRPGAVA